MTIRKYDLAVSWCTVITVGADVLCDSCNTRNRIEINSPGRVVKKCIECKANLGFKAVRDDLWRG